MRRGRADGTRATGELAGLCARRIKVLDEKGNLPMGEWYKENVSQRFCRKHPFPIGHEIAIDYGLTPRRVTAVHADEELRI